MRQPWEQDPESWKGEPDLTRANDALRRLVDNFAEIQRAMKITTEACSLLVAAYCRATKS